MASDPLKVKQHQERERVRALSHLFDPDPEKPNEIAASALALPLPEGLTHRLGAARELKGFLGSSFADVRRLAASALGKMSPEQPAPDFLPRLVELAENDPHPQVRQYAAKAIGKYPKAALLFVDSLKDVARDETAPGYVRTAAAEAVAEIQKANRSRIALLNHWCTRCRRIIDEEQYQTSMERWGRAYCRHCSDEKEFENHDFESKVDAAKAKRTTGGTAVQSWGEKRIAEFLEQEGIAYEYDERYRISGADTIRRLLPAGIRRLHRILRHEHARVQCQPPAQARPLPARGEEARVHFLRRRRPPRRSAAPEALALCRRPRLTRTLL